MHCTHTNAQRLPAYVACASAPRLHMVTVPVRTRPQGASSNPTQSAGPTHSWCSIHVHPCLCPNTLKLMKPQVCLYTTVSGAPEQAEARADGAVDEARGQPHGCQPVLGPVGRDHVAGGRRARAQSLRTPLARSLTGREHSSHAGPGPFHGILEPVKHNHADMASTCHIYTSAQKTRCLHTLSGPREKCSNTWSPRPLPGKVAVAGSTSDAGQACPSAQRPQICARPCTLGTSIPSTHLPHALAYGLA